MEPDANDIAVHWEWQSITRAFGEQADVRSDSVDARGLYKESLIALERLSTWVRSPPAKPKTLPRPDPPGSASSG